MRVLFTTYSERTHFLGMVPLAWALQAAGHEVRVVSHPELTPVITGAGLTAMPVSRNHPLYRIKKLETGLNVDVPLMDLSTVRLDDLAWPDLKQGYQHIVRWWWGIVNDSMIDDLVGFCRSWRPDLVLWEPLTYAGAVAAVASGAVHGRVMWSVDVFARMRGHFLRLMGEQPAGEREDVLARWLGARVGRYGGRFAEVMTCGQFTVDSIPGSLRRDPGLGLDLGLDYLPVRYVPYNGASVVPSWLRQVPDRPRVGLSLGTTAIERFNGYAVSVGDILESLADLDVEVVATLAESQQKRLGRVPGNVRLVSFVPLNVLAPTCDVLINHGGPGTLFTTLVHGVPQLVLPNIFDEPLLAGYLATQGAGLMVPLPEVSGGRVRAEVQRLLHEPQFRAGAQRLREEMLALPTPNEAVTRIEQLVTKHRDEASGAHVGSL